MSFPDQSDYEYQTAPQRSRGCSNRLLLLLIIGGIAMYVLRDQPEPQGTTPRPRIEDTGSSRPDGQPGTRVLPPSRDEQTPPRDDQDDWSIEEVKIESGDRTKSNDKTDRGDWTLEEVDSKPSSPGVELDLGNPAPPKKTEKGDWSLEEVEKNGQ